MNIFNNNRKYFLVRPLILNIVYMAILKRVKIADTADDFVLFYFVVPVVVWLMFLKFKELFEKAKAENTEKESIAVEKLEVKD